MRKYNSRMERRGFEGSPDGSYFREEIKELKKEKRLKEAQKEATLELERIVCYFYKELPLMITRSTLEDTSVIDIENRGVNLLKNFYSKSVDEKREIAIQFLNLFTNEFLERETVLSPNLLKEVDEIYGDTLISCNDYSLISKLNNLKNKESVTPPEWMALLLKGTSAKITERIILEDIEKYQIENPIFRNILTSQNEVTRLKYFKNFLKMPYDEDLTKIAKILSKVYDDSDSEEGKRFLKVCNKINSENRNSTIQ